MKRVLEYCQNRNRITVLEINERLFRLIELKKHGKQVEVTRAVEKHGDFAMNDLENSVLKKTVEKCQLSGRNVIVHLPGNDVRQKFINLPTSLNDDQDGWLKQNLQNLLPSGLNTNDIVIGYKHFEGEACDTLLITIARKELIQNYCNLLANMGLTVIGVIGGLESLLSAYAFSERNFFKETWAFLHLTDSQVVLLISIKGNLFSYDELAGNLVVYETTDSKFELLESKLKQCKSEHGLHQIILSGDYPHKKLLSQLKQITRVDFGEKLLKHIVPKQRIAKFLLALGVGLESLIGKLETRDLRPSEFKVKMNDRLEKRRTLFASSLLSFLLALVWLTLFGYKTFSVYELNKWQREVAKLEEKINEIEQLKSTNQQLSSDLMRNQKVMAQKTNLSKRLFEISSVVPNGVWLRMVNYAPTLVTENSDAKGEDRVIIDGLSLTLNGATNFLSELEKLDQFVNPELSMIQKLTPETVFKKTKSHKRALFKFQLKTQFLF